MNGIADNLNTVRARIAHACRACDRDPSGVTLIAVSKTQAVTAIEQAHGAGQTEFGENYLQEGLSKIQAIGRSSQNWHFIGPVQSNKTREIAEHFHWVHTVDRLKIAQRLSAQRPAALTPLNVCVQVNISAEASKSGCLPDQALDLCVAVAALPELRLRGLMAIPEPTSAGSDPRAPFRALRGLYAAIRQRLPQMDTLSAGMSDDLEAAIAEGSTMVRIGTAIFGKR